MDILVSGHGRRLAGQDAELRPPVGPLKSGRSDPELASQEVSEVLAAVRGQLPLDDDDDEGRMEPVADNDQYSERYESTTDDGTSEYDNDQDTIPGQRNSSRSLRRTTRILWSIRRGVLATLICIPSDDQS